MRDHPEMLKKPTIATLVCVVVLGITVVRPAYAYIDPGTGSLILQLIVAGILGSLFALKSFWRKVIAFVKGLFTSGDGREGGS